jgi:hypothetical protein
MKGKQLAVVLALLIALGGAAVFLRNRNAASWSSSSAASESKLLEFPLNDVAQVTIKGNGTELNLTKKDDAWRVSERADYPADFDKVSALLRKLWEMHPAQEVKVGPSQLGRLQLNNPGKDANSATLVELKGAGDKRLAALVLGKKHLRENSQVPGGTGFPMGRYVMRPDGGPVFLVSETLDEIDPKPETWVKHDFVRIEKPKSIALVGTTPEMNWRLVRENETAPWKFADAKAGVELDASKASSMAGMAANLTAADVLDPKAPPAETGLDHPTIATIETFEGFSYELRIGKVMGANYAVTAAVKADLPKERTPAPDEKPEDKAKLDQEFQTKQQQLTEKLAREQKLQDRAYLIAKPTMDALLKSRTEWIKQQPSPNPAPAAPGAAAAPSESPAKSMGDKPSSPPSPSPAKNRAK